MGDVIAALDELDDEIRAFARRLDFTGRVVEYARQISTMCPFKKRTKRALKAHYEHGEGPCPKARAFAQLARRERRAARVTRMLERTGLQPTMQPNRRHTLIGEVCVQLKTSERQPLVLNTRQLNMMRIFGVGVPAPGEQMSEEQVKTLAFLLVPSPMLPGTRLMDGADMRRTFPAGVDARAMLRELSAYVNRGTKLRPLADSSARGAPPDIVPWVSAWSKKAHLAACSAAHAERTRCALLSMHRAGLPNELANKVVEATIRFH